MDLDQLKTKTTLTIQEATQLLSAEAGLSEVEARQSLCHAIESGELPADIVRWATEQWHGERLEGNLDRKRTHIGCGDLDAWLKSRGISLG